MRTPYLALLLAGCAMTPETSPTVPPDPEREAVLAVVQETFDALAAKGPDAVERWRGVLLGDGVFTSVRVQDGARRVSTVPYDTHLTRVEKGGDPRPYLERIWDPTVLIDGDVAVVWARFDFWLDGELSHGGRDAITLVRTEGGWRVAALAWTHEEDAPASPLGRPD